MNFAVIAQQVERILGKDEVPGSNPGISSIRKTLLLLENSGVFLLPVVGKTQTATPFLAPKSKKRSNSAVI